MIIVTSLIVVPPTIWMYRNFSGLYHPLEKTNRWDNLDTLTNFVLLWSFVILSSYVFSKILGYIYKIFKINLNKEQEKQSSLYEFFFLLMMLYIVVSIFSTMDFLSRNPVVLQQPECTRWEPSIGKGLGRYVKCEDK
ncbi:hypothetical protein [Anabaena lutea]|uniref:hypothetical protein n=1 Tax=Anabaena lutea TaxID=212350 RepID=UPI001684A7B2|nr:hypothetical protein [Anabaena lutea]